MFTMTTTIEINETATGVIVGFDDHGDGTEILTVETFDGDEVEVNESTMKVLLTEAEEQWEWLRENQWG